MWQHAGEQTEWASQILDSIARLLNEHDMNTIAMIWIATILVVIAIFRQEQQIEAHSLTAIISDSLPQLYYLD